MMTQEEIIAAVKVAAKLGVTKIRLTGGEPLVKKDIVQLVSRIKEVNGIEEICLTTNASLLPKYAADLKKAGLDRINISLDTLNPDKFKFITRVGELKDTLAGIDAALNTGFKKVKINSVLIGGFNDDEIVDLANLTLKQPTDGTRPMTPISKGTSGCSGWRTTGWIKGCIVPFFPGRS